jgi:hypothetical protein
MSCAISKQHYLGKVKRKIFKAQRKFIIHKPTNKGKEQAL